MIGCQIINNLDLLENAFESEFESLQRTWSTKTLRNFTTDKTTYGFRNKRSLDFLGEGLSWCCGVATQHKLDSLIMNENELADMIDKLNEGVSESIRTVSENSKRFSEYEESIKMSFNITESRIHKLENFIDNFKNTIIQQQGDEQTLILSILNRQLQNLIHNVQIVRALRRQGIINSCRQHQVPIAILTPPILLHDLKSLEDQIGVFDQELAIGTSEIAKYYQLPLCDCAFYGNKMIINIRVPVNQKSHSWELLELLTVPFRWDNQTCVIEHNPIFLAVARNSKTFDTQIRQISGSGLRHCKPYQDKLCYIPRFSADSVQGPECAKKLYNGATVEQLNYHCPMRCHKSNSLIISEIAEETYIITHPKPKTEIKCQNKITKLPESFYTSPGAIKVTIPCNCELISNDEEIIPKRFPCPGSAPPDSVITHIIPAAWSNLKSFILKPNKDNQPQYLKLSESLNKNWTLNIPHLNLTSTSDTVEEISENIRKKIKNIYSNTYGLHSDSIFLIWNALISICLVYILFKLNHPLTIVPNVVQTVRANDSKTPIEHDIFFGILCILLVSFISYLLVRLSLSWTKDKRQVERQITLNSLRENDNNEFTLRNSSPKNFKKMLSVTDENFKMENLKPGQNIACSLHILDDECTT